MRLKYDLAKILERYVLISYSRIKQSQLPEGLFKYDLRSGGELEFATLEKSVFVKYPLIKSSYFHYKKLSSEKNRENALLINGMLIKC